MRRSAFTAMVLAVFTVLFYAFEAHAIGITPEMAAAFAKEPPLTQKDINAFIKFAPEMQLKDDGTVNTSPITRAGLSEMRGSYVMIKLPFAYAMAADPDQGAMLMQLTQAPASLKPSTAEINLIKKNFDALSKAMGVPPGLLQR